MNSGTDEEKFKKIIAAISKAAHADGKITDEEREILEAVHVNIMIYDQAIDDAVQDGIITKEEKDTLSALKYQILNDAWDIASISDGVSDDELTLLQVLLKELEQED